MPIYKISIEQTNCFNENIKYIIDQIKNNLNNINVLENKVYVEMSKEQIIESFSKALSSLEKWQKEFKNNNLSNIQKEYKEIESIMSELEWSLFDYEKIFHCEGMSYTLYQIGNLLVEILNNQNIKEKDLNS